jgi:hypothetical protein
MKTAKWFDAHHIVARASRYRAAVDARSILRRLGVGIDTKANGINLPRNVKARKNAGASANMTTHHGMGVHSHETMQAVLRDLQKALDREGAKRILRQIGKDVSIGNYPGIHP